MEFYSHVFYLIEPRREFSDWLRVRVKPDVAEILLKSVSYQTQEKEDPTWLETDRLMKVKIVFLNALRHAYPHPLPTDADFAAALGSLSISEALFDQWWTISRRPNVQWLAEPEGLLAFSTEPSGPTGSARVDEWLARLRDRAKKPLFHGSVLFHSPGEVQISAFVRGYWERPVVEVLEAAGAVGVFGSMADDACAGFLGWCFSKNSWQERVFVENIPGGPWRADDWDPYDWYDKVMAEVARWDNPPFLVNLDEYIITYRDQVVSPASKRDQERPKDPRSMLPGSPFRWGWYGQGLGELRPGRGTYTCYPYESLPPIPVQLDGTFRFLRTAGRADRVIENVKSIEADLAHLIAKNPPGLPQEFVEFFRSPKLWGKIRSCTGCYFHVDPAFTAIPGGLGWLVRFLRDSQDCIKWHLHLSPDGTKHAVVATYHFSGSENAHLEGGKPHARDITTCAGSFEEFIYRFWLEIDIWYALAGQDLLPENGKEYLAHYRSLKFPESAADQ